MAVFTSSHSRTSNNMPVSSPPPSILKTSKTPSAMAGQKRKIIEIDASSQPSSSALSDAGSRDGRNPVKRARVQFDDTANTARASRSSDDNDQPQEKSVALVREEIRRAIQRHVSGADSEGYDQIKEIFTTDPKEIQDEESTEIPSPTSMKRHMMALLSNVAALNRDCSGLVHAVLGSEWLGRDESYVKLFVRFLGNLAATHTGYMRSVLKMLVNYFGEIPKGTGRIPGYSSVTHEEIYDRVHMALRYIMQLLPAGSSALSPILAQQFPFDTDSARANVFYTRNLIRLIEYAPELRADILSLVTERLVKIDVQIQVDMEEFEDEVGEDILEELSRPLEIEYMDEEDDSDGESVLDDEADIEARRLQTVKDNISKVDSMIDQLFEFYSSPFNTGTDDTKSQILDLLLSHFVNYVLPTYRSRHTQFLVFHFSQFSPDLVEKFVSTCMHIIDSKTQPAIMRQSAAAYLGSFVARGKHVTSRTVRDIFEMLGENLSHLRTTYEATCRGPDLRRYGPFYASTQAILYIFCFRWRDLTTAAEENDGVEDDDDDFDLEDVTFPPSVKEILHQAIYSRFNPLKVCSPAIVTEFARIAHRLRFMYVYSLLESNKRIRMSSFRSITTLSDPRFSIVEREIRAGNDGGDQLDAYFPFDPYQLPRSRRWLEGDYIEWRGIPGVDDREDDSDSGVEREDDVEDDPTATDEE
ncbi:RNA polymerase I specific transcription initiation factor RRN3 superfamily [Talaromyces stipitatus ATCC 10500]|uniref:RNA polymerase I specific transcription initiation factor RRN3 superfamily n=1 Tax=Talaromyces stipitatus (strain ATCC 10500 / CBS 375.48 / QM 6759 / NRRL 1006) TaxID=441959 RepID=B8MFR0_TALSN|nr:RNA polymerase I-specific transcription initiation factor RRN3 family protein [Talaromyces stipitatus ATCC 10500]EED17050.1 RNA polymerase I specific transcription initiation factor RRN3 superfamily [Talaromyces stipitatus ATCC 10500]